MAKYSWRKTKPEVDLRYYRECIIIMMRHGRNVDHIARDLDVNENHLINFIKSEGIDKRLGRRSWAWKSKKQRRKLSARDGYTKKQKVPA